MAEVLYAALHVVHAVPTQCIPRLSQDLVRRGAAGDVVNVTCLEALGGGALEAGAGGGFYAATKAALRVMGEALRQEVRLAERGRGHLGSGFYAAT